MTICKHCENPTTEHASECLNPGGGLMTMRKAKEALKLVGVTIAYMDFGEEYRVNLAGGREATAYYTSDLEDAYRTGLAMAEYPGTSSNPERAMRLSY